MPTSVCGWMTLRWRLPPPPHFVPPLHLLLSPPSHPRPHYQESRQLGIEHCHYNIYSYPVIAVSVESLQHMVKEAVAAAMDNRSPGSPPPLPPPLRRSGQPPFLPSPSPDLFSPPSSHFPSPSPHPDFASPPPHPPPTRQALLPTSQVLDQQKAWLVRGRRSLGRLAIKRDCAFSART